jgi:hypothetical protein
LEILLFHVDQSIGTALVLGKDFVETTKGHEQLPRAGGMVSEGQKSIVSPVSFLGHFFVCFWSKKRSSHYIFSDAKQMRS